MCTAPGSTPWSIQHMLTSCMYVTKTESRHIVPISMTFQCSGKCDIYTVYVSDCICCGS